MRRRIAKIRPVIQGLKLGYRGRFGGSRSIRSVGGLAAKMIPKSLVDQTKRLREIDRLLHLLND